MNLISLLREKDETIHILESSQHTPFFPMTLYMLVLVKLEVVIDVNGQSKRSPKTGPASPEMKVMDWHGSAMEEGRIAWKAINKHTYRNDESVCVR